MILSLEIFVKWHWVADQNGQGLIVVIVLTHSRCILILFTPPSLPRSMNGYEETYQNLTKSRGGEVKCNCNTLAQ